MYEIRAYLERKVPIKSESDVRVDKAFFCGYAVILFLLFFKNERWQGQGHSRNNYLIHQIGPYVGRYVASSFSTEPGPLPRGRM